MTDPTDRVMELVTGRWRSQALHAGVEVGVFEAVGERPKHAVEIADELGIDTGRGYRLLRALASLDLLRETDGRRFALTESGAVLQADHPDSLAAFAQLEEGPVHYAVWKHLPDVVREGDPNGFHREFGHGFIEHQDVDPDYAEVFNRAMSSLSRMDSAMVADLLAPIDVDGFDHLCDVGGGHGHLLCSLLAEAPTVEGTVLELPPVVEEAHRHWHEEFGLADRVEFVAGDFFESVPTADAYLLKHILHDWDEDACVDILSTVREGAPADAKLFTCEFVVPGPDEPHLSKIYDLHMMVATGGQERTEAEYASLFEEAGFDLERTYGQSQVPMEVLEARAV